MLNTGSLIGNWWEILSWKLRRNAAPLQSIEPPDGAPCAGAAFSLTCAPLPTENCDEALLWSKPSSAWLDTTKKQSKTTLKCQFWVFDGPSSKHCHFGSKNEWIFELEILLNLCHFSLFFVQILIFVFYFPYFFKWTKIIWGVKDRRNFTSTQ